MLLWFLLVGCLCLSAALEKSGAAFRLKKIMKKFLLNLVVIASLIDAPIVSRGSTVIGNLIDGGANPASVTLVRFQPVQPSKTVAYLAVNTNTMVPYPAQAIPDMNNNFSVWLVGGFYDTYFGTDKTLPPLRILVPMNDTNTYNLNQVAQLAVNASMFGLGSVTITNVGGSSGSMLWTAAGTTIYPSGATGTSGGWVGTGSQIYPQ